MASNASTDSLSEVSDLATETGHASPFDAEDTSDDVANFFQTMTMSMTRRLSAKNVVDGVEPYIYETITKTTTTLISHSLTPPIEMLKKARPDSASTRRATRRDEADPVSEASPPQTETHAPKTSSVSHPGLGYRPKVKVYSDEIPGWPRYPDAPSSGDLSGHTAPPPPTASANNAVADGQATPPISTADLYAPPLGHPWLTSSANVGNPPPLHTNASSTAVPAPPDNAVTPTTSFTFTITPDALGTASATSVADAGSQATTIGSTPAVFRGASAATSQTTPSASPSRPSARGSQLRFSQIKEVLGEK